MNDDSWWEDEGGCDGGLPFLFLFATTVAVLVGIWWWRGSS